MIGRAVDASLPRIVDGTPTMTVLSGQVRQ